MEPQASAYIDLGIGGMTCDDCVQTVTRAIESVPGVVGADVSLADREASVSVSPGVEPGTLTAAVRASGYNAFVRRRRDPATSDAGA